MSPLPSVPITIANICIELSSPLSPAQLGIQGRLKPFIGVPERPLMRVALRWEESAGPPAPEGTLIYDPGSIWRMYRSGERYCAAISYHEDRSAQTQSVLLAKPVWEDLTLREERTGAGWHSLLGLGAGELILRATITFTEGLVLHASGLDDNGQGIVFVGHAGAGKSTQVSLWSREPGVIAMNDDRIAVRAEAGGPMCYGTPWGGTADIARNHAAPLAALIMLEQAPENAVQPLPPSVAAPLISARAFLPYWDQALMRRALANLSAILASVPVYRLRCRPESAVIPLVRSVL